MNNGNCSVSDGGCSMNDYGCSMNGGSCNGALWRMAFAIWVMVVAAHVNDGNDCNVMINAMLQMATSTIAKFQFCSHRQSTLSKNIRNCILCFP